MVSISCILTAKLYVQILICVFYVYVYCGCLVVYTFMIHSGRNKVDDDDGGIAFSRMGWGSPGYLRFRIGPRHN